MIPYNAAGFAFIHPIYHPYRALDLDDLRPSNENGSKNGVSGVPEIG